MSDEARGGPGCAVWTGDTVRFLRRGEPTPKGYEELDPLEARGLLRPAWSDVRSFVPAFASGFDSAFDCGGDGVLLATPGVVGSTDEPEQDRDVYRLQVAQKNGQWAWLTPVWAER